MNLTYPCVVGHRIVELTAEQRDAQIERLKSPEQRLSERIATLESTVDRLLTALENQGLQTDMS